MANAGEEKKIGRVMIYPYYRVALHLWEPYRGWLQGQVVLGPNPYGPRGGRCGNLTPGGWKIRTDWYWYDRSRGPYLDALADLVKKAITRAPESGLVVDWEKLEAAAWKLRARYRRR